MTTLRIGVFGCGNMGQALVQAIKGRYPGADFFLYTPTFKRALELAKRVGGNALQKIEEMPLDLDWYILGFKPQNLNDFEFPFLKDSKILSVLAGVKTEKLSAKFNSKKIARLMPNTPSAIGLGANLLYLSKGLDQTEGANLCDILGSTGTLFPMEKEEDIDLATAFSGSGPALLFELARIFESELNQMTEGRLPARDIVAKTFFGSSALMNNNGAVTFSELREQVTSKKGVTYEALQVLEQKDLQGTFASAFRAAYKRTLELSN